MNLAAADRIAKAVLYEGYMLYPYRPSAVKNQQRFNFGVICPKDFSEQQKGSDSWIMQSECLVQGTAAGKVEVRLRFLQLVDRSVEEAVGGEFRPARSIAVGNRTFYGWQEAVERELTIAASDLDFLGRFPVLRPIVCGASASEEPLLVEGRVLGRIVRTQNEIEGSVYLTAQQVSVDVFKITVRVKNCTPLEAAGDNRDFALLHSLVSSHLVLGVEDGEFVSLLDPPESLRAAVGGCENQGVFPVLIGEEGQRDTMLASPIILYDYPQIAPESAGDLFDGTEIDEILSLRILTMTDEEKREMRDSDDRARQILQRTESLPPEQFMKLHGALRGLRPLNEETR